MIKKSKSEFYLKLVTENLNNPSKFWKTIKSVSSTPIASSLPEQILIGSDEIIIKKKTSMVSQFNKHFIQAGSIFDNHGVNRQSRTRQSRSLSFKGGS